MLSKELTEKLRNRYQAGGFDWVPSKQGPILSLEIPAFENALTLIGMVEEENYQFINSYTYSDRSSRLGPVERLTLIFREAK